MSKTKFLTLAIILAAIGFYAFSATPGGLSYDAYTHALMSGRLNIDPTAHGDISVYRGRYYMYFGPAPVITLLIPWRLLTHHDMPQGALVAILVSGIFLFSLGILSSFFKTQKISRSRPEFFLCALVVGFCNFGGYFLRWSAVYEAAIASATMWTLSSAYCAIRFILSQDDKTKKSISKATSQNNWIIFSSISAGMAVASRYSSILSVTFILCWALRDWSRNRIKGRKDWPVLWRQARSTFGPFLFIFLILGILNYIRFGNFLEFGAKLEQGFFWKFPDVSIGLKNVWQNLIVLFCSYTPISFFFPFLDAFNSYYFFPFKFHSRDAQPVINIFLNLPFLFWSWVTVFAFIQSIRGKKPKLFKYPKSIFFSGLFLMPAVINLGIILIMPTAPMRYLMDFLPFFLLVSCLSYTLVSQQLQTQPRFRKALTGATSMFVVYGVVSAFFWSMSGHLPVFKKTQNEKYRKIERSFDWVTDLFFDESQYGPIQMKVRFNPSSSLLEPIVLTGRADWNYNAVFVKYPKPQALQFGVYPSTELSSEVAFDPNHVYTLEISLGSLYPSGHLGSLFVGPLAYCIVNSPFSPVPGYLSDRGFDARNYSSYQIKLDGKTVAQGSTEFFPSTPHEVQIGVNPTGSKIGWSEKFSGEISEISRLPFLSHR